MSKLNTFCKSLDQIPPSGIRKFFDYALENPEIISLGVGEPDFPTPKHIAEAGIKSVLDGNTCYSSNKGLSTLRKALSTYLNHQNKVNYNPENEIVITNGASEGIDIVLRALLNPGDAVIVPEPSYVCYSPLVTLCGANVQRINTAPNNFICSAALIKNAITPKTRAIMLCSPNNPTGTCIPKDELIKIAALAKEHELWVISDEIYSELQFDDLHPSITSCGLADQTIVISGFSKAFAMTGWRLGYIAGPERLISKALKIHQYSALCAPTMAQYAAVEALKQPLDDVQDMKKKYNERRLLIIDTFKDLGFAMPRPTGAFYCFPDVSSCGLDGETFANRLLEEEGVAVVPGNGFGLGGVKHIRCCYAYPIETIEKALKKIRHFVKTIKN